MSEQQRSEQLAAHLDNDKAQETPGPTIETKERLLDDGEYLKLSREMGVIFTQFVSRLVESSELAVAPEIEDGLISKLVTPYIVSARELQERQQAQLELHNFSARTLLEQFYSSPEQLAHLANEDSYYLQQLSPGIVAVRMSREFYNTLRNSPSGSVGQAVAQLKKDGFSFITVPHYAHDDRFNKRQEAENLRHETHHMVWFEARNNNRLPCTETHPELKRNFIRYQDELIATLCSDGSPHGYNYLTNPEYRKWLGENYPETLAELQEISGRLYDLVREVKQELSDTELKKEDLLLCVFSATSHAELEANLLRMLTIIKSQPKKEEPPSSTGFWGGTFKV